MPYLGKSPSQGVRTRFQFTPNAGTTSISGADANGLTLSFTDGNYVDVYLNGVMLKAGVDYNTNTANTIAGLSATVASDVVDIVVYDTFSLFGGTLEGNVKVNNGTFNVTGAVDFDSTLNVDGVVTTDGATHDGDVTFTGANYNVVWDKSDNALEFGDNAKVVFGAGSDLQIYHDGNHSYISDQGTGNLLIQGSGVVVIEDPDGNNMIYAEDGGEVILYHNASNKLETTSSGVTVTGSLTANGGVVVDNITIDGTEIDLSSGTLTIDAASIALDASDSITTPTAGTSNVKLGVNAGNSIASGAYYNVVIGDEAGTAITTGDGNTAIGYESLKTEDTGHQNVAVGEKALKTLRVQGVGLNVAVGYKAGEGGTTGTQNTFIGGLAGDAITTGTYNVALGTYAITDDTTGQRTTAIGYGALSSQNFTGSQISYNTAVGYVAGAAITTGQSNSLVGYAAGDALTTGFANTVLGSAALSTEDTGRYNVAIGAGALENQNNDVDNYNVAVGYNAGNDITTGYPNTIVGGLAGDAITVGYYNTVLGYNALSTAVGNVGETAIGHQALSAANYGSTAVNIFNTAVGYSAGQSVTTGYYNTLVGGACGDALTNANYNVAMGVSTLGADTKGSKTTAIGYAALGTQNLTTSTDTHNTAIGYLAGGAITTGRINTIVGSLAADALTTGVYNVAIGQAALGNATSDNNSTAIGQQALSSQNTQTDSHNVGVGYLAGAFVSTGTANTFIGSLAGYGSSSSNLTGYSNTCLGYVAGYVLEGAANSNTFIGSNAGRSATTATLNTTLGLSAGRSITNGSGNIMIGVEAGHNSVAVDTGDNNILIGYQARASSTSAAQQIVMGRQVSSTGDNNFTFGDTSTDSNIAFGATSISAPSDERYKEEITTSTAGLSFINDLRPVTFKWKKEKDVPSDHRSYVEGSDKRVMLSSGETNHGFIAQEVKTAIDAHSELKDGFKMWSSDSIDGRQRVAEGSLIPILTKAIQELSTKLTELEAEVTKLKEG